MKWSGLLTVVAVLLLPASARAQGVTLKALTGAWLKGDGEGLLIIRGNDSTFNAAPVGLERGVPFVPVNYLRGDTISLAKSESAAVCRGKRMGYCGEPGYKITLKGRELTLTKLGKTGAYFDGTYTRLDAEPDNPWRP